jgi:hypothetical protein
VHPVRETSPHPFANGIFQAASHPDTRNAAALATNRWHPMVRFL